MRDDYLSRTTAVTRAVAVKGSDPLVMTVNLPVAFPSVFRIRCERCGEYVRLLRRYDRFKRYIETRQLNAFDSEGFSSSHDQLLGDRFTWFHSFKV